MVSAEIFIRAQREGLAELREGISRRPPQIQRQRERGIALFAWDRHVSRCMPGIAESGQTPTLRLEGINGKLLVG